MKERSLLAYFNTEDQAQHALKEMKGLRIIASRIDRFDGFAGNGSDRIRNPITGDIPGLGYLTLNGDFDDRDAAILAATHVSASGLSSGGRDNQVTGRDILLTVVIEESDLEMAAHIAQENGALL
ncbi:hypothetical protein FHS18_006372 [Paenibacillus phyllosphaerae]|uniref:Uncharacterized protein n=1 Tax=Paenibacillus phyllosphaerae TaxID=274593 RepID=A0A7W5FRF3_9BACL|nr:hypothetical protein [Paenibacillus phyllosphaerae]MBB3114252.1 hypothetical protein [Paenibacillus phyllosphaerae]